jgi:hypothetical protein
LLVPAISIIGVYLSASAFPDVVNGIVALITVPRLYQRSRRSVPDGADVSVEWQAEGRQRRRDGLVGLLLVVSPGRVAGVLAAWRRDPSTSDSSTDEKDDEASS